MSSVVVVGDWFSQNWVRKEKKSPSFALAEISKTDAAVGVTEDFQAVLVEVTKMPRDFWRGRDLLPEKIARLRARAMRLFSPLRGDPAARDGFINLFYHNKNYSFFDMPSLTTGINAPRHVFMPVEAYEAIRDEAYKIEMAATRFNAMAGWWGKIRFPSEEEVDVHKYLRSRAHLGAKDFLRAIKGIDVKEDGRIFTTLRLPKYLFCIREQDLPTSVQDTPFAPRPGTGIDGIFLPGQSPHPSFPSARL